MFAFVADATEGGLYPVHAVAFEAETERRGERGDVEVALAAAEEDRAGVRHNVAAADRCLSIGHHVIDPQGARRSELLGLLLRFGESSHHEGVEYAESGREVVYPSPGYPLYESFIPYFCATPVPMLLREEDGFGLTRDALEPLLGDRTALIFLNFPSNPTGSVATRAQLEEAAGLILERTGPNVRVYSDESYEAIGFDGHKHVSIASIPGMESRTIIASGCSKTYSWTGGRVGWAVYPTAREAQMARRLSINHFASISPYNQWAAIEALQSPLSAPAIDEMVKGFQHRRDIVVDGLNAIDEFRCNRPQGAFYAFPNVGGAIDRLGAAEAHARLPEEVRRDSSPATLFQLFLLNEYRVATMDRRSFNVAGSEGQHYLRLSTATSQGDLEESVRRMAAAAADEAGFQRFVASGARLTL